MHKYERKRFLMLLGKFVTEDVYYAQESSQHL